MPPLRPFHAYLAALLILSFGALGCGGKGGGAPSEAAGGANPAPPVPALPIITMPLAVTAGSAVLASVPAQDGCTFTWGVAGGTVAAGAGTPTLTVTAGPGGTLSLSCFATNAAGVAGAKATASCAIDPMPVTPAVTLPPFVTAGAAGFFASVPDQPGCVFTWSIQNGTLTAGAGTAQVQFTAGTAGSLTLTCVAANGAGSGSAPGSASSTVVLPPSPPVIAAPGMVTQGQSGYTASVSLAAGTTCQWSVTGANPGGGADAVLSFTPTAEPGGSVQFQCVAINLAGTSSTPATASSRVVGAPPGTPAAGAAWVDPYTGSTFHFVPAGSYQMGASPGDTEATGAEVPVHAVTFAKGFWISETKVSQADWIAALGVNPASFQANAAALIAADTTRPVESVSWEDAQTLLAARSTLQGWWAYRLPSEAEWEYACRAGATTPYPWGSAALDAYACYVLDAGNLTKGLGALLPNAWGLFDMEGDTLEWCADTYLPDYTLAPGDGSARLDAATPYRVLRGGAWNDAAANCRASARYALRQTDRVRTSGLRLVMPAGTAPHIQSFTAASAGTAGNATLSWVQSGAASLFIDHGVGAVQGSTRASVTCSSTTVFTLVATNADGWSMATVTVKVP